MKARLFAIQRFSVQDGPGVRTSVFFKGCPLHCYWCHNPESSFAKSQLMFYPEKCIGCRKCENVCPQQAHIFSDPRHFLNREACISCGACTEVCPENALELAGYDINLDVLAKKIERDRIFYEESGGGVTFTGGEPLFQHPTVKELARICTEKNIHTAIETSLFGADMAVCSLDPWIRLWICDMKAFSNTLHIQGTGVSNETILRHLEWLLNRNSSKVWVRIPLIPGFNDIDGEFRLMGEFLSGFPVPRVELMPYHSVGESKYAALGFDYKCSEIPDEPRIRHFCEILVKTGVKNVTFSGAK